jgi:hypothetical protein
VGASSDARKPGFKGIANLNGGAVGDAREGKQSIEYKPGRYDAAVEAGSESASSRASQPQGHSLVARGGDGNGAAESE